MMFSLYVVLVVLALFTVWWVAKHGKIEFVSHARLLFKTWSVWLATGGSAIGAWAQSFPDSATTAWDGLPADVKSFIPQHYLGIIASFMVAMAVISQFIRQKGLKKQLEAQKKEEV